jgi:hypothetical protein
MADCLENQFTSHDLCDENHKREVGIQAKLRSHLQTAHRWGKLDLVAYIN